MNRIVAASLNSRVLSYLCTLFLLAGPVFAQNAEEKLPPYDVQGLEHKRVWVPWMFAFLFAILTIFIAFKNPRRSHQD